MNQIRMPKKSVIAKAWAEFYGCDMPWGEVVVDWGEPRCFACHAYAESWPVGDWNSWNQADGLERCHIVPKSVGGGNAPLNFVLLCNPCHIESPDHGDSKWLFKWMSQRPKRIFGRLHPDFWADMQRLIGIAIERNISTETLTEITADFYREAGDHFGHSSDGTHRALIWKMSEIIEGGANHKAKEPA